jgi:hypothetical protein
MKDDFQLKFKKFVKRIAKHAKWAVLFHIINIETYKTGCFAKHGIASSFVKQEANPISLETLPPPYTSLLKCLKL